jgi:hypothetical protein
METLNHKAMAFEKGAAIESDTNQYAEVNEGLEEANLQGPKKERALYREESMLVLNLKELL